MGLPQTIINFQTLARTLQLRTENGIVALLLKDDTATKTFYEYTTIDDVKAADLWSDENKGYLKMVFSADPKPRKIYVARVGTATPTLATALQTLGNKLWDYLAFPGGAAGDMTTISAWIKGKRDTDKKTYKAVIAGVVADHEGVINFTTTGMLDSDNKSFDNIKFTARIVGVVAGIGTESSSTYYVLPEIQSITDLADDTARNTAIDNGELILINDGEKVKIARGVNSLKTTTTTKGKAFQKIRIVEIIDTIRDDITLVINETYRGKVLNTYANKLLLVAAINTYFSTLVKENVLDENFTNLCQIDYEAQRAYLLSLSIKVENLSREDILKYNTNDQVFLTCNIKTIDSMEDFIFQIYLN